MEVIYVFSDGGIFDLGKPSVRMGSSFVITTKEAMMTTKAYITKGGTSPRAEALGMYMAVKQLLEYLEKNKGEYFINIVMDNEVNVKAHNIWINGWIKKAKGVDNEWKSASGTPVKNQDVHRDIYKILKRIREIAPYRIYHINSHIAKKNIDEYKDIFNTYNKTNVDIKTYRWMVKMNSVCDELVSVAGKS